VGPGEGSGHGHQHAGQDVGEHMGLGKWRKEDRKAEDMG
jgi:hypothetical protein